MCMTSLDTRHKRESGFGYKLLRCDHYTGKMFTGYMNGESQQVEIGKPVVDSSGERIHLEFQRKTTYPSGFHIFTSKQDVRNFQDNYGWCNKGVATVRVKYSKVVATGRQHESNVVVAKEFTATKAIQIGGILA